MEKITFFVAETRLKGTLQYPDHFQQRSPAVLFIHGWTSCEKGYIPRAAAVSKLGYTCLTFNMRGHGESEGDLEKLSRKDHIEDCLSAYDFLASQSTVDPTRIHVIGASYGGYMASMVSAQRKVASLVLRAPALYPDKSFQAPTLHLIRKDINIYQQHNIAFRDNKALSALHVYTGKVLLIECENDTEVPKPTTENYAQAVYDSRLLTRIIIPGADHALTQPQWNQFFIEILVNWFTVEPKAGAI